MADKLAFYDAYGVEEYYVYDPPINDLEVLEQDPVRVPEPLIDCFLCELRAFA